MPAVQGRDAGLVSGLKTDWRATRIGGYPVTMQVARRALASLLTASLPTCSLLTCPLPFLHVPREGECEELRPPCFLCDLGDGGGVVVVVVCV